MHDSCYIDSHAVLLISNDFILAGMALPTHKTTMTIVNPTSSKVIPTNSTTMPIANMRSQTVLPAASKVIATTSVAKLPQIILSSHTITNTTGTLSETILRAKTTLNHKVSYAQPVSSKIIRGMIRPVKTQASLT